MTTVPPRLKDGHFRTLIGSHTLPVKCNNRRAALTTESAQNRVLESLDFGREIHVLNGGADLVTLRP